MTLINPMILFGAGLALIPIILHFLLRSKPKKLLFPALQLIARRRRNNVRRMRLRHVWLLLLRVGVILLLVAAITRPSLPAANYALSLRETISLAVIIAIAVAAYQLVLHRWKQSRQPQHSFVYRRTLLRGGTAAVTFALLLLLVVWPYLSRISAEWKAPLPENARNLPVAAVFLFDNSVSMNYQLESRTRLEQAQEIAAAHLENLPPRSRVAIAETSSDAPILFQADATAARARIDAVEVRPGSVSLNQRLRAALALQEEDVQRTLGLQESVPTELRKDQYLREIYIFSDMTAAAWQTNASRFLREELERLPWTAVYLIDVSIPEPENVALGGLRIARQTLPMGGSLVVRGAISATGGDAAEQTVELHVQNENGELIKKGQTTVKVESGKAREIQFVAQGMTRPITHGQLRLVSSDPLMDDNVRNFTVAVRPPPEILLVAPSNPQSRYWYEALALTELLRQGKQRYQVTRWRPSELSGDDLAARLRKFSVVNLIGVPAPDEAVWRELDQYVQRGGGLAVFTGGLGLSDVPAYESEAAQNVLPGRLLASLKHTPPEYIDLKNTNHPLIARLHDLQADTLLSGMEINRFWRVEPQEDANVIATYTDPRRLPAIVEKLRGQGRVLMTTTAVDRSGWSELWNAQWAFLALADLTMQYLGSRREATYNAIAGDEVVVPLDPEIPVSRYLLRKPGQQQLPGEVPADADSIIIRDTDQSGHYEVVGADPDSPFASGFSINASDAESDLTPLAETDLDRILGEERYSRARTIDDLDKAVDVGRIGQEVFPYILVLVLVIFCGEHIVANRFYQAEQSPTHT